jgi:hypothetical protein
MGSRRDGNRQIATLAVGETRHGLRNGPILPCSRQAWSVGGPGPGDSVSVPYDPGRGAWSVTLELDDAEDPARSKRVLRIARLHLVTYAEAWAVAEQLRMRPVVASRREEGGSGTPLRDCWPVGALPAPLRKPTFGRARGRHGTLE